MLLLVLALGPACSASNGGKGGQPAGGGNAGADAGGNPGSDGGSSALGSHGETIPPSGGTVTLAGYASVTFAAGAFPAGQLVTVEASSTAETEGLFDDSAAIFQPGSRLAYEVRIDTGGVAPANDALVAVIVPATLDAGSSDRIEAFAQFFEGNELDSYDHFELIPSRYDAAAGAITLDLPPTAFTGERRSDHAFEAVVTLAVTPGDVPPAALAAAACRIRPPLETVAVRSPFDANRKVTVNGKDYVGHWGTDLVAADGTPIYAVSDGDAIRAEFSGDMNQYPRGGNNSFGRTIVFRTPHSGVVRYAHLQEYLTDVDDTALAGQLIGYTDNTGTSTGSHLHFELAPDGHYLNDKSKVDPVPCFTNDNLPWHLEADATYDNHSLIAGYVDTWTLVMHVDAELEYDTSDPSGITLRLTGGTFTMVSYTAVDNTCSFEGSNQIYPIVPASQPLPAEGETGGGFQFIWLHKANAGYSYGGSFLTAVRPPVTRHCGDITDQVPVPSGAFPWWIPSEPQPLDVKDTATTGSSTFDFSEPGQSVGIGTLKWTLTKYYQSY